MKAGRLHYTDTQNFEVAKFDSDRLLVRDGKNWTPIKWRLPEQQSGPDVTLEVLWDERTEVERGVEFVCEGPCTIENACHVYVRKNDNIAYTTPKPHQYLRLAKGTMFAVPFGLQTSSSRSESSPLMCGEATKTGKSRQSFR
jgi:hypothetical protein